MHAIHSAFVILLLASAVFASQVADGPCHNLVVTGPNGLRRTVNLDPLSELVDPFAISDEFFTYTFKVCSNVTCGGGLAASCEATRDNQGTPLSGKYPAQPRATLTMDGAITFQTTSYCFGRSCRYSTITVVCDPFALCVLVFNFVESASTSFFICCCSFTVFSYQYHSDPPYLIEQQAIQHPTY